jgi:hypothetical protein
MPSTRNAGSLRWGLALLVVVAAEFERAVAAEQRYADLKRSNSTEPLPDLPRLVFDEFYALEGTGGASPRHQPNERLLPTSLGAQR